MKRISLWSLAALAVFASHAVADVYFQVPFVRVRVGGPGVYVRAPFVSVFAPSVPRVYVMPGADVLPPANASPQQQPQAEAIPNLPKKTPAFQPPAPKPMSDESLPKPPKKTPAFPPPQPKSDDAPPAPAPGGLERVLTLEQFTKGFQPKAGNYEVTLLNPVSKQATTVRFTLPEGTPRRVHVSGNQIEFDYGPRQYVRIRFDRDGAEVISR